MFYNMFNYQMPDDPERGRPATLEELGIVPPFEWLIAAVIGIIVAVGFIFLI